MFLRLHPYNPKNLTFQQLKHTDIMKSFNMRRFWLTLKWDLLTNMRYNVRHWLIMLTLFFFAILLPHACVITEGDKPDGEGYVEQITDDSYNELPDSEKQLYQRAEFQVEEANDEGVVDTLIVQGWEREYPPRIEKWESRVEMQHTVSAIFLVLIVAFYFTFSASLFLNNMTTKQRRITFLSLPASRSEKLLARWIYAVPIWFLMVLTAFVAGDLLRYAVQPVIGPYHPGLMITWLGKGAYEYIRFFGESVPGLPPFDMKMFVASACLWTSSLLMTHSTYILGSALFRRFPWLVTTGIVWAFSSIVSILLFAIGGEAISVMAGISEIESIPLTYAATVFHVLVSVLFYWLAIRVFCRMQVINNKFLNV